MTKRIERVNEVIKKELATIVSKEIEAPNIFVTLIRVEVSSDLHYADVYFLTIPDEASRGVEVELNRNVFSIQQNLNKRLRMRPVPKIRFRIDKREQEAAKIDEILKRI
ncbi:MAG: 30S ribosome-binding factor RbfA [Candidatus Spechtbacterales bacterium]